jgi:hypothetical protein
MKAGNNNLSAHSFILAYPLTHLMDNFMELDQMHPGSKHFDSGYRFTSRRHNRILSDSNAQKIGREVFEDTIN